ncbi:beta-ketoacyl-ACP synthase III [Desulfurivibrio alkaliphilus]|uniref:Beta-ketoacyl-[acyl-carrier-protein] synthase III n=1 Tax=Desulfurivibrio alkaliphilus (strain DSM 19089 / UNIQEM U267 / AHT2) TaxID=589865 RepID=D6Z360_DESAT|nr:beta-ketoacyl-ACP synthase III [Desulfurivibrio alkaliphilus]ADH85985.1 3-oxoacyl-(acyl-carrier-protein) synthase III [Desulfurivibrio alkaliphilus AHT 2]
MMRTAIIGTGSQLPERVLSNTDLEGMVETSDEWITTRTGIKTRRIAGPGEETSLLAAGAARRALAMAGVAPEELDLILVGTITPDMTMPSCACLVQKELKARRAFAMDLNAACSGFLYALDVADKYVRCNPAMKVLVIGAETLSSRVDWQDRNTCVLFGDGAGACVVTGREGDGGYLAGRLFADGNLWQLLHLEGAPGHNPGLRPNDHEQPSIMMYGREVFRHAVRAMADAVGKVLADQGVAPAELSLVIPHQANIRIIRSLADHLALPMENVYVNVDKYGNTSAATIPIALDEAHRNGRLRRGDLLLLCSFGGGFTWGASLIRW